MHTTIDNILGLYDPHANMVDISRNPEMVGGLTNPFDGSKEELLLVTLLQI